MKEVLNLNMVTVWLVIFAVFLIVEIATAGALVSIWFCIGALAALGVAYFGGGIILQIVIFSVVSLIFLFATKPLIKRYIKPKKSATNADAILHEKGIVEEEINNIKGEGVISVGGKTWTARNLSNEQIIPKGAEVIIEEIQGVKAMVKIIEENKGEIK